MKFKRRLFIVAALCIQFVLVGMIVGPNAFAGKKVYKVAFFAASSQNGFNQAVYSGIQRQAKAMGNIETAIYNGEFNAMVQYGQIEDVIASKKFDAFVVLPNDTVGIASVVQDAVDNNYKVAAAYFPVGPDLNTLKPQVKGLTVTVASLPVYGATEQAKEVVGFCKSKNPCNVIIIIGQKIYPFDNLRYSTYLKELGKHKNIRIRATVEGNYDPDKSMSGMQDAIQANQNIHVVLSNADQHLIGAEIALEDAGYDVKELYLIGGGASQIAIDAIREGRWDATLADFPRSVGEKSLEAVVKALQGKSFKSEVDMNRVMPLGPILSKELLDANPSFKAEWQG